MRKQDVRTGVVYAYRRSALMPPEPCVLVSLELRTGRDSYRSGADWSTPAGAGARPDPR